MQLGVKSLSAAFAFLLACSSSPRPVDLSGASRGSSEPVRRDAPLPIGAQAWSVSGRALGLSPLPSFERAQRQAALDAALADWSARPDDPDALIWVGRRLGYLWRFREALDTFTIGVERFPTDARMRRFRGHRWISVREFDRAIEDLERAAQLCANRPDETEPDGVPNARGVPLETLKSNIYYHLGLARYLVGDFAGAEREYRECLRYCGNPDNLCSATHWLYTSLRRQGKDAEAARVLEPIRADLDVVEYHSYFQLCRAYQGELDMERVYAEARDKGGVDFGTAGYGAGAWNLCNGNVQRANEIFREIVASDAYYAFGYIASEVELSRR